MTRRVIIRIEAEVDITDAALWYEGQQRGLGHEFLASVEAAITVPPRTRSASHVCGTGRKSGAF